MSSWWYKFCCPVPAVSCQVVIILLDALRPEAALSLPPIFDLLVSAARDLQGEFIDLLPAVWNRWDPPVDLHAISLACHIRLLGYGTHHGISIVVVLAPATPLSVLQLILLFQHAQHTAQQHTVDDALASGMARSLSVTLSAATSI